MQYDAIVYGSKINCIFVFANHKGTTQVPNTLIIIFDGVHFRKMCGFINLLLKFNMYVFSSRCKSFKILENVLFSFFLKYFKDSKKNCSYKYFFLKSKYF